MASKLKITKNLPSYLEKSSKGGLLIGFIYVIAFMSILFLAIWQTFESENNKSSMKLVDERLSLIEEQINIVDETNNDTITDISSSIQFLDKEVRKLWDLSNKRNRRNIETTMKSLETLQEQSDDMVKKSQLNEESLKRLALSLDKTRKLVARISGADNSFDQLESKISEIEEANKSNMAFREQISEALIRIQADLSSLEIALEDK